MPSYFPATIKISTSISHAVTVLSITTDSSINLLALKFKFLKKDKIYQLINQALKARGQSQQKQVTILQRK